MGIISRDVTDLLLPPPLLTQWFQTSAQVFFATCTFITLDSLLHLIDVLSR